MPPRLAQALILLVGLVGLGMAARSQVILGHDGESLSHLCLCCSRKYPMLAGLWCSILMPLGWWAIQDEDKRWRMVGYFLAALAWAGAGHIFWSQ